MIITGQTREEIQEQLHKLCARLTKGRNPVLDKKRSHQAFLTMFEATIGFTQGGLFSMLLFCIAVCMHMLQPLREKWPSIRPWCIADDAHAPTVVREAADIKRAAQWCTASARAAYTSALLPA